MFFLLQLANIAPIRWGRGVGVDTRSPYPFMYTVMTFNNALAIVQVHSMIILILAMRKQIDT